MNEFGRVVQWSFANSRDSIELSTYFQFPERMFVRQNYFGTSVFDSSYRLKKS